MVRKAFISGLIICASAIGLWAQKKETYGMVSYQPPAGWKKEFISGAVTYSRIDGGSWSQMAIYAGTASKGDSRLDAQSEWEKLVLAMYPIEKEEKTKPETADGWTIISRSGVWKLNGVNVATLLTTYSNGKVCVSLLCNATAQPYLRDFQKLAGTVELNVQQAPAPAIPAPGSASGPPAQAIAGIWGSHVNETSGYSNGYPQTTGGYFRKEYRFNHDGTYVFLDKVFPAYSSTVLFRSESGSWSVTGNKLTVSPVKLTRENY